MLGVYLFSAIIGVGLLLFTVLSTGDFDSDAPDADVHAGGHDGMEAHAHGGLAGEVADVVLGLFKPRNLTFLLAAFGTSGTLLTWAGTNAAVTLALALAMGFAAWILSHAVFTWLKRTDSSLDVMSDRDLEGSIGTVTNPIGPGRRGRITLLAAGRQTYMVAALEAGLTSELPVGTEVLVRRTEDGIAEVIPTAILELPPKSS